MQGPSSNRLILLAALFCLLISALARAEKTKLSGAQRQEIIRAFLAERAYAHRTLPLGKAGVVIEGSTISPSEAEVVQLGAAARVGERVQITGVRFVLEGILFEINGGPVKHEKWSDRIRVGMGPDLGTTRQPGVNSPGNKGAVKQDLPEGDGSESKGATVLLKINDSAGISAAHVKTLLAPVLDFSSTSQEEAYQKNLSPVLTTALKEHRALVGMDRDMVLASLGRPLRRMRESADGQEYEEWIYGTPPQDIQFIRFVRGKVVRIEQMKITGEKQVRTADEVGKVEGVREASSSPGTSAPTAAASAPAMASPAASPTEVERKQPPTLLHPGEAQPSN